MNTYLTPTRVLIAGGIVPENWLFDRSRVLSIVRALMLFEMVPEKELPATCSVSRFGHDENNASGKDPDSRLCDTSNILCR